jgi:hypothetical protein
MNYRSWAEYLQYETINNPNFTYATTFPRIHAGWGLFATNGAMQRPLAAHGGFATSLKVILGDVVFFIPKRRSYYLSRNGWDIEKMHWKSVHLTAGDDL